VAEYDFLPVNPLIGQPGFPNPWFTYVYMLFIQHEVCPQKKNIIIIINTKNTSNMRCATRKKNIIIIINTKNTSNMRCATRKKNTEMYAQQTPTTRTEYMLCFSMNNTLW
jgi:hypothetical protein